ncbi:MAG: rRNA methyltransferase [Myxococcaceae bacterium]|nr:rRNA methyltransferase [Myxococcaceae bacterium]
MKRLHLPQAAPGALRLEGPRFHHLIRVLRVRAGEALEVFDGRGTVFPAQVGEVGDEAATLTLGPGAPQPAPREITIVQGLPKAEKLEWVLQKCTELGAAAFAPVFCERTIVKPSGREDAKVQRWQRIVEEAARQSGRAEVPTVHPPRPLLEAVGGLSGCLILVLDEEEEALSLSAAVAPALSTAQPLALVIGPEGGLSRAEVAQLQQRGAVPVTLGRRVLRTETAALAALAVLLHLQGELG